MAVDDPHIENIRQRLEAKGDPGDPHIMAEVIQEFPVNYQLHLNACLDDVKSWLEAGDFLITQGWFTSEGHVICLSGLQIDTANNSYKLEVKDPWSEFDPATWSYNKPGVTHYDGYYSSYCIYAACVAGSSAADAATIYKNGELDSSVCKMWVHRFMPSTTIASDQSSSGQGNSTKVYVVQAGDSLSGIASQCGVSLAALEAANPQIANPNAIDPGESLNIP
jgi:hypothetical protein